MDEIEFLREMGSAIRAKKGTEVERLLRAHPEFRRGHEGEWLHDAARYGTIPIMDLLLRTGINVNAPLYEESNCSEGPLAVAAREGHLNAVRWLLERGAASNCLFEGKIRNIALEDAAMNGNLEIVRLLVEHGADVNATWNDCNPLTSAMAGEKREVIAYLQAKGAKEPWQLKGKKLAISLRHFLSHVAEHLGRPQDSSLEESEPRDPSILIHFVPNSGGQKRLTLVTSGMSNKPMKVPVGELEFQFAELYMHLPGDWPTTVKKLNDTKYRWPIDWLRAIAHQPHDAGDWLGGKFAVIANGDPPEPIATKVPFTAFFLATLCTGFEHMVLEDHRFVRIYNVMPIYTEEYNLARKEGPEALIKLFEKHKISQTYDPKRPNVALKGKK